MCSTWPRQPIPLAISAPRSYVVLEQQHHHRRHPAFYPQRANTAVGSPWIIQYIVLASCAWTSNIIPGVQVNASLVQSVRFLREPRSCPPRTSLNLNLLLSVQHFATHRPSSDLRSAIFSLPSHPLQHPPLISTNHLWTSLHLQEHTLIA